MICKKILKYTHKLFGRIEPEMYPLFQNLNKTQILPNNYLFYFNTSNNERDEKLTSHWALNNNNKNA